MKKILLSVLLVFMFFSISEGKSWEKYFYDLITSTNSSIKIVDEQNRVLTMDELGVIISSNVSLTVTFSAALLSDIKNIWVTSGTIIVGNADDFLNVWLTSGIATNKNYKGENSTGTVLAVGSGSSVSRALQSTIVGVYIDAEEDNTDIVRYRLGVDEDVNVTGNKLHPGDFIYIGDFKGTIYFQSEAGTQSIIINEVDE